MEIEKRDIQRFPLNNDFHGILQAYKHSSIIQFNASESVHGPPEDVLSGGLWESGDNPYFSVLLTGKRIRLSHVSLFSCYDNNCVNGLKVEGKNYDNDWQEICRYTGNYTNFYRKNGSFACVNRSHAYNGFRLTMLNTNLYNEWVFPMYNLEFYGEIFPIDFRIAIVTFSHMHYIKYSLFLIFFLI